MGLLNSFRDGNDLNLGQLDNISDAVWLVCRCTWAERTDSGRFGKNMAADVSAKKYAETSQAKNICQYVSCGMWGISGVSTLALTVA